MRPEMFQAAYTGFSDSSGNPLVGGKLYTYDAGTSTPRTTWTSPTKSVTNANPVILDSLGRAELWCDGNYKFDLRSAADVSIDTVDNVFLGRDDGSATHGGSSTGGANVFNVTLSPALTEYATGQKFSFVAHQTNTTTSTGSVNSLGSRTYTLTGLSQIYPGAIQSGGVYQVLVTATALQLLNPHTGTQSYSPTPTANGGGSLNTIVTNRAQYNFIGSQVKLSFSFTFTTVGVVNSIRLPLPIATISSAETITGAYVDIGGGSVAGFVLGVGGGASIDIFHYASTAFAAGATRAIGGEIVYSWI